VAVDGGEPESEVAGCVALEVCEGDAAARALEVCEGDAAAAAETLAEGLPLRAAAALGLALLDSLAVLEPLPEPACELWGAWEADEVSVTVILTLGATVLDTEA